MFKCQRDSFLTEYETEVKSWTEIEKSQWKGLCKTLAIDEPKNEDEKLYEVILEDTILFPEGGGQPDDRGFISKYPVVRVVRKSTQAIHYIVSTSQLNSECESSPVKQGDKVLIQLDWKRRFDHMQQHSGQHLITAIADKLFEFPTTSWWLGSEDSYIELDAPAISDEQLKVIEEVVNDKIRQNVPLTVEVVDLDDAKLQSARGRNLPDDVKGQIRIITMGDIESNVCCGTHVSSLSQLQAIKLLYSEKRKGKSLLHFLCGERVLNKLSETFQREQRLGLVLKTCPNDLVVTAEKLNIALKNTRKSCQTLSKDLASLEAKRMLNGENKGKLLWHYHRENVDLDFGSGLLRELGNTKDAIILVTLKTDGNNGHLLLHGGEDVINSDLLLQLGERLCAVLDGKGTLRGNVFQAKVSKITGVNKALKLATEFVQQYVSVKSN